MKTLKIFFAAALLSGLSACGGKADKKDAPPPPTPVSIKEAKMGNAVYYDQYQGTVVAINSVELRSQLAGFITATFVKDGQQVHKGQPLYEIDRRKYQAAYDEAKANVASAQANQVKAQKDIDRYNFLLKQDAVARQTVDNAQAAFETAKSQVAVAKAGLASAATDLSYSIIKAPFSGRIGIAQVKLGSEVAQGTTVLNTISAENPMGVDIVVNEQDINRFYDLQKYTTDSTFKLKLSGDSLYSQPGKVLAIDRGVNNQTGTIKVRIQFNNQKDELKDGMSAALKVLNDQSGQRVIIPYKAVTEQMGEFFVFIAKDTVAFQKKVSIGPRLTDNVVIMKGINAGDKVITEGFQRLRDSGKITLGIPKTPTGGKQGQQAK